MGGLTVLLAVLSEACFFDVLNVSAGCIAQPVLVWPARAAPYIVLHPIRHTHACLNSTAAAWYLAGLLGGDPNKPPSAKSLEKAERKRRQRQQWHAENQEIARQCAKRLAPQQPPVPVATAIQAHRPDCGQPAAELPCSSESMEVPCMSSILADPCQAACQLTEEASCYQIVFEPWCCQLAAEVSYSQVMEEPRQPCSGSSQRLDVPCGSSISEQPSQPPQEPTLAHYIGEPSSCGRSSVIPQSAVC